MESSWFYHVFLISFLQHDIVIQFIVVMVTLSPRGTAGTSVTDRLRKCSCPSGTFVDAPCPPPNKLHLVCDFEIGEKATCSDRLIVIQQCFHKFRDIYTNSNWTICTKTQDCGTKIVDFLNREKLIDQSEHRSKLKETTTSSEGVDIRTAVKSSLAPTYKPEYTIHDGTSVSSIYVTTSEYFTMTPDEAGAGSGVSPPDSYLFPLIGSLFILVEFVVLCAFFCYNRKKGVQYEKQRKPSQGSEGVHEEPLTADTATPNKSAPLKNSLLTEGDAQKEDQNIFKSYLNLKYIDESEENTPERRLLKL